MFKSFALAAVLTLAAVVPAQAQHQEPEFVAVCSTTQVADFVRQVAGDRWEVKCILAPGADPHLYQINPNDVAAINSADLCFENGWHLEGHDWMRVQAENAQKPLVTCVEGLDPLEIDEGDGVQHDPHAWFSPANAVVYVRNIFEGLSQIDPDHREEYQARAELAIDELRTLDRWIRRQVSQIPANRRVLVTSHDAFNYFCRDYGFEAASPIGWSTGQEIGGGITAEARQETVDSIREHGVKAIFVETSVNQQLIEQIAEDAGVAIGGELYSDSMGGPGTAGETYAGMMRENVITIVMALK